MPKEAGGVFGRIGPNSKSCGRRTDLGIYACTVINKSWLTGIDQWFNMIVCNCNGHYVGCRLVIILNVGYQWQFIQAATIKTLKDVYNFLPVIFDKCGPQVHMQTTLEATFSTFLKYFVRPIESSKLPWIAFMIKHPNSETTLVYSVINLRRAIFDLSHWGKMPFFGK